MTKTRFNQLALFCVLIFASSAARAQLPDGPGKDTFLKICGNCHAVDVVAGHNQGNEAWSDVIGKMIEQGAEGTDEQFAAILDYLVKNFGPPVNINKASAADLQSGLDLTDKQAAAIVKYRTAKGAFKTLEDLKNVPDLDYKKIEAKKDHITF
jgi:competence protein ComEA